MPKIRIEVVVTADYAARVVETIQHAAHTGSIGDGKIFVIDVEEAVRIRHRPTEQQQSGGLNEIRN